MHEIIVGGQREHLGLRLAGADAPQCLESPHARHGEIHDHHVGIVLDIELARRFPGLSLGDDRHVRHGLQQQAKSRAHDRVIVDQEHANHGGPSKGMSAVSRTPRPS